MTAATVSALGLGAAMAATLPVGFAALWGALALWYRSPGGRWMKALCVLPWGIFGLAVIYALWRGHMALGLPVFAAAFATLLGWWSRVAPARDRPWADDVSRITTGTLAGSRVTLHNVRNFDWLSTADYVQRWETRSYNLDGLHSVDMIMSYWRGRAIAHMLISFGFEAGSQVAFSVEVRREKIQAFSELGGFFKEFELSIIAADEGDVVRVRTNIRREDAYLYRLRMPPAAMRALFLGYIREANALQDAPRFYNTVSVNCTTLVYHMMTKIVGRLPLDYRLLFSGYLPEYVYELGGLDRRYPLAELRERGRITERARQADRCANFSAAIRRGVPGTDP